MKSLKNLFMFLMVFAFVFLAACSSTVYTVTFDTDCDAVVEAQEVKENKQATQPADPTREGYNFGGWYLGEEKYDFSTPVVENITLVAKWSKLQYTVTFVTNCDATVAAQTVNYGETATQPSAISRDGYKFAGWFNGADEYDFATAVTANITLTAQWEELKYYTIQFKVGDEIVYTESVEEGKNATPPADPSMEGQTFIGWTSGYTSVSADATVEAIFAPIVYSVQFKVNGEDYGDPFGIEHGSACEAPDDPSVEGYVFKGWDADFSNITADLTVNAIMEAIEYTIKYYSGETEITTLTTVKYTVEDSIALEEYNIANYYFYAWYDNANLQGEPVYQIYPGTTGAKEFYALNVTVDTNGGEECWSTEFPTDYDPGKGIDEISNLPEIFEMDFFNYLSDNELLGAEGLFEGGNVTTWAEFSGVNPYHNGDPKRIWNDTAGATAAAAGQTPGYTGKFLYGTLELNEDGTLKDVEGGFLGTEPYKSKYTGLLNYLLILYKYKVEKSNYGAVTGNTNTTRNYFAFIIDGYFYGTQGKASGYFTAARSVIPGINFSYKLVGEEVVKFDYEGTQLPTPVKDGYAFDGWYVDAACTQKVGESAITNLCTVYAKWEQFQ